MPSIELELRTVSESNRRGHWSKHHRRTADQRFIVGAALRCYRQFTPKPKLPARVKLTRIAPRKVDDDNLRGALKATRDSIADWFGINDGGDAVTWDYAQEQARKRYAVRIEIEGT